jgi:drug/metabolite transporter (DMT)-like permease
MTAIASDRSGLVAGAALIASGMTVVGLVDNLVPMIAPRAHVWQFHLIRGALALTLLGAILAAFGRLGAARPKRLGRVAARSLVVSASMLLYYVSLPLMPVAEVAAGLFTSPLWVLGLSALLLGAPVGLWRLGAIAVGFAGAMMILRPDAEGVRAVALLPLTAGALYGAAILMTRTLCAGETTEAIVIGNFSVYTVAGAVGSALLATVPAPPALVAAAPFVAAPWGAVTPFLLGLIVVNALGAVTGIFLVTRGYQRTEPAAAALFDYSFLISASFWAWVFWGQALDAQALAGCALIVAAGAAIALGPEPRRRQAARPGEAAGG